MKIRKTKKFLGLAMALVVAVVPQSSAQAIEIAGELFVDLSASNPSAGT